MDETLTIAKLAALLDIFQSPLSAEECWETAVTSSEGSVGEFERQSPILEHQVFNSYHSEHLLTRYMKRLENKVRQDSYDETKRCELKNIRIFFVSAPPPPRTLCTPQLQIMLLHVKSFCKNMARASRGRGDGGCK